MTAYNVVRFRAKPGREKELLASFENRDPALADRLKKNGLRKITVIKTGDRSYCLIGEWDSMDGIVKSRPDMVARLDLQRGMLEDLGGGLGEVVLAGTGGAPVARLSSSGSNRFNGRTETGEAPVTFYR